MITSQQISLLSELREKPIPEATLVELEARLQHRIHAMVLDAFNESGLSQKELADRLGWDTARVSRCLGSASNWTLKTISALLAAIGVDLDDPSYTSFDKLEQRLRAHALSTAAARPVKRLTARESLAARQLKFTLFASAGRSCGATFSVISTPAAGAFDATARIQRQAQGSTKIRSLNDYRPAAGQEMIGVAT